MEQFPKAWKKRAFFCFFVFNGISTFVGNLMPMSSLYKNSGNTIQTIAGGDKGFMPFPWVFDQSERNSVTGIGPRLHNGDSPKELGGFVYQKKDQNYIDHSNFKICLNSEKSPGDFRVLAVAQTPMKDYQLTLV